MVVDVVIPDRAVVAMLAPDASAPRSRTTQRIVRRVRALLSEKTPNARLRAGRIYEMETIATDDDLWA
jgi:hypothetical protein